MTQLLAHLRAGELVEDDVLTAVMHFLQSQLGKEPPLQLKTLVDSFEQERAAKLLIKLAARTGVHLS